MKIILLLFLVSINIFSKEYWAMIYVGKDKKITYDILEFTNDNDFTTHGRQKQPIKFFQRPHMKCDFLPYNSKSSTPLDKRPRSRYVECFFKTSLGVYGAGGSCLKLKKMKLKYFKRYKENSKNKENFNFTYLLNEQQFKKYDHITGINYGSAPKNFTEEFYYGVHCLYEADLEKFKKEVKDFNKEGISKK